jgi:hypothetical protein
MAGFLRAGVRPQSPATANAGRFPGSAPGAPLSDQPG